MASVDELLENNRTYAEGFSKGDLPARPAKKLAVLACMDARMDVHKILGLDEGDAHVIRNAGGAATDDAIRSLLVSQRLLGTEEIVVIHHTDCGMGKVDEDELRREIERDAGHPPPFELHTFTSLEEHLRRSVAAICDSPFIGGDSVRGFIYDVKTGTLSEVGT